MDVAGSIVGTFVGCLVVGAGDGVVVGCENVGLVLGDAVGARVIGAADGTPVGNADGPNVGIDTEGNAVGLCEGEPEGVAIGAAVRIAHGM